MRSVLDRAAGEALRFVPVNSRLTWASSMFPRKERKCYDLPLNATVRKRVGLQAGNVISVAIDIPLPV